MHWLLRFGGVLALVLALGSSAYAATDGTSPATALTLTSTASLSLNGSTAGAYRYLDFSYPTAGTQATLTLNYSPADPSTANAVGVNLWQNGALLATTNGVSSTPGSATLAFSSSTAGPILAQLYNYTNGESVDFTVDLTGLGQPAPPAPAPSPAPATGTSGAPRSLAKSESGTLPGNSAGSYAFFSLDYPGDGSTQSVMLSFSPPGPDVGNAVFVNVYQNGTLLTSVQGTDTSTPGQLTASYSSTTAGPVLIQLANFNPDATISYTLSH